MSWSTAQQSQRGSDANTRPSFNYIISFSFSFFLQQVSIELESNSNHHLRDHKKITRSDRNIRPSLNYIIVSPFLFLFVQFSDEGSLPISKYWRATQILISPITRDKPICRQSICFLQHGLSLKVFEYEFIITNFQVYHISQYLVAALLNVLMLCQLIQFQNRIQNVFQDGKPRRSFRLKRNGRRAVQVEIFLKKFKVFIFYLKT